MIVKAQKENVENLIGTAEINLDNLIQKSHENFDKWEFYKVDAKKAKPVGFTPDMKFFFTRKNAPVVQSDISQYAAGQLGSMLGIPVSYLSSLFERDLNELAVHNVKELVKLKDFSGTKVMKWGDSTEAILSDKFNMNFPIPQVLETVRDSVDLKRYMPNQAFLSKGRCHLRFVDFETPVYINDEKLSVGFTVDSSDIGQSSLRVQFFIYKFSCMNGIVKIANGGTLFRQAHLGSSLNEHAIEMFRQSFSDIELLRNSAVEEIKNCQKKMLSEKEMEIILDSCRKNNVSVSEKEKGNIIELVGSRYGKTRWGVINAITEVAQNHTLENRLNYEIWAGRLLSAA